MCVVRLDVGIDVNAAPGQRALLLRVTILPDDPPDAAPPHKSRVEREADEIVGDSLD